MSGIVVFGGAGFIGSNLVNHLLSQGHTVTVFDNFSEGKRDNLVIGHQKLDIIKGDIRNFDEVKRVTKNKDWVFHLAAMSRIQPSIINPVLALNQNVMGTVNVLEACKQNGVKRVVYSASSSAYGEKNEPPMTENMKTDCLNPYSLSKKVGEELMDLYNKLYGLSTISLRYFNVYGPKQQEEGDYSTVIAIFMRQNRQGKKLTIVGDGEQRRDFTFVGDVVHANMLAVMNRDATGVFNIGSGKNFSINEVADIITGEKEYIPPRPAEAKVTLASCKKANEILGWKSTIDLFAGIKITQSFNNLESTLSFGIK